MARIWTEEEYEATDDIYVDGLKREAKGDDVSAEDIIDLCQAATGRDENASVPMHLNNLTYARAELGLPTLSAFGKGLENAPKKLFDFLETRYADHRDPIEAEAAPDATSDDEADEAARAERRVWTDEEYEATDSIYAASVTREARGDIVAADEVIEACREATGREEGGSVPMHLGHLTFARSELGLPTLNAFGDGLKNTPQKLSEFLIERYDLIDTSPGTEAAVAPAAPEGEEAPTPPPEPVEPAEPAPARPATAPQAAQRPPERTATATEEGPPASASPLVWIALAVGTIVAIAIVASLLLNA